MSIVAFPFPPNWSALYDETFTYNTKVLGAADGSEQTISIWGNNPRRSLDFNILLTNHHAQMLDNLLFARQGKALGVPHWSDGSRLTAVSVAGANTLALDTAARAHKVGGSIIVWRSPDDYKTYTVSAITNGTITTAEPLAAAWPIGTRVYPIFSAFLSASLSGRRHSDQVSEMPMTFACEPNKVYANTPVGGATPMYRGEELYLGRTNWKSAQGFSYQSDAETLDYNVGKFRVHTPSGYNGMQRAHVWLIKNRAEGAEIRAFLGRREGRARPVYMPNTFTDFTLKSSIGAGSSTIDVETNLYETLAAMHPARRDIVLLMRDGTYYARRIVGSATPAVGTTRFTLDSAIPIAISAPALKRISLLTLCRQAIDSATIHWHTDDKGTLELDFLTLRAP